MTDRKDPKKSESLEVRVPWRLKQEFMARARREGRSASEVIRALMQDYVRRPVQRKATQTLETAMTVIRKRPAPAFAAIAGAAGISAVLAGVIPAAATPDLRAEFRALDANGDGAVTMEELEGGLHLDHVIVQRQATADDPNADRAFGRVLYVPSVDAPGQRRLMVEQLNRSPGAEPPLATDWTRNMLETLLRYDADGDHRLSADEYIAANAWLADQAFTMMDTDGDGMLTAGELIPVDSQDGSAAAQTRAALDALDADRDGRITRAEYGAAL